MSWHVAFQDASDWLVDRWRDKVQDQHPVSKPNHATPVKPGERPNHVAPPATVIVASLATVIEVEEATDQPPAGDQGWLEWVARGVHDWVMEGVDILGGELQEAERRLEKHVFEVLEFAGWMAESVQKVFGVVEEEPLADLPEAKPPTAIVSSDLRPERTYYTKAVEAAMVELFSGTDYVTPDQQIFYGLVAELVANYALTARSLTLRVPSDHPVAGQINADPQFLSRVFELAEHEKAPSFLTKLLVQLMTPLSRRLTAERLVPWRKRGLERVSTYLRDGLPQLAKARQGGGGDQRLRELLQKKGLLSRGMLVQGDDVVQQKQAIRFFTSLFASHLEPLLMEVENCQLADVARPLLVGVLARESVNLFERYLHPDFIDDYFFAMIPATGGVAEKKSATPKQVRSSPELFQQTEFDSIGRLANAVIGHGNPKLVGKAASLLVKLMRGYLNDGLAQIVTLDGKRMRFEAINAKVQSRIRYDSSVEEQEAFHLAAKEHREEAERYFSGDAKGSYFSRDATNTAVLNAIRQLRTDFKQYPDFLRNLVYLLVEDTVKMLLAADRVGGEY